MLNGIIENFVFILKGQILLHLNFIRSVQKLQTFQLLICSEICVQGTEFENT